MKPSSINQTAYRTLKLLSWLRDQQMTFEQINRAFENEQHIGKRVSQDTLWLYLNTLKSLGCEITRPTSKNGYTYKITQHFFGHFLTSADSHLLKQAYSAMDDSVNHWDVIYFNRWLNQVFNTIANKNRNEMGEQFFEDFRQVDFDALESQIKLLENHCAGHQLLEVAYESPGAGIKTKPFLPDRLYHAQGMIYVLGYSQDQDGTTMLRLDRIRGIEPLFDIEIGKILLKRKNTRQVVLLRLLDCELKHYTTLFDSVEWVTTDPIEPQHTLVRVETDNTFWLKQKLLSSGYVIQILYPESLREEFRQTLESMWVQYQ